MNFRQFELKQSQYEVGDFVLIASSNDDFQEDPLESAYVARLDDLYSDGIFMMIISSFSTLFTNLIKISPFISLSVFFVARERI